jgi:hypothetical protein
MHRSISTTHIALPNPVFLFALSCPSIEDELEVDIDEELALHSSVSEDFAE